MYLTLSFLTWLNDLVLFQGLLFGTTLILLHFKNKRQTFFLGIFVLLFSLGVVNNNNQFIPASFYVIIFPFFYLHVQRNSVLKHEHLSYWTLIPGIIELIISVFLLLVTNEASWSLKSNSFKIFYAFFSFCYCLYISILVLKWVYSHSKALENQDASQKKKTLIWVNWFVPLCVAFYGLFFLNFIKPNTYIGTLLILINVSLVFWSAFNGIVQTTTTIDSLVIHKAGHHNIMSKEEAIKLLVILKDYIEESKCYVNDKLTIVDLSEAIHVHPKRISFAINSVKGIHFNRYINYFRVGYAKVLLKSKAVHQLSIEGIGIEAGFHSKTTFYSAFKRLEGMTPLKYKMS